MKFKLIDAIEAYLGLFYVIITIKIDFSTTWSYAQTY